MIDLYKHPELIKKINLALNSGETIEIKNEARNNNIDNIVIVKITRQVITTPNKSKV